MRFIFVAVIVLASAQSGPAFSVETCGNLADDNQPNRCQVKIGDTWITKNSSCQKTADGKFQYVSCDGHSHIYSWADACCLTSRDCPGAQYVGTCVGH